MLKDYLSKSGYKKAMKVVALEDVLLELQGISAMIDLEKYHISIYGNPAGDKVWSWSLKGHH